MSTDPSSGHSSSSRQQQNGSPPPQQPAPPTQPLSSSSPVATASPPPASVRSCDNLVTDQVLLREVAEIAEKVRELESSVPCQLEFNAHDNSKSRSSSSSSVSANVGAVVGGGIAGPVQPDDVHSLSGDCGKTKSDAKMQTITGNSTATTPTRDADGHASNGGDGGVADQAQDTVQQSSERLIIKLDANKSSGDGDGGDIGNTAATVVMDDNRKNGGGRGSSNRSSGESNILCPAMNEEDIKALVKELKRKIEYTERMNWLCKYYVIRPPTPMSIYPSIALTIRKEQLPNHLLDE